MHINCPGHTTTNKDALMGELNKELKSITTLSQLKSLLERIRSSDLDIELRGKHREYPDLSRF